jgi:hypothetical protein
MNSLRNTLLLGGLLVLSACATQTIKSDQVLTYVITRSFTPFYQEIPKPGSTTDTSLSEKTRVKLLRNGTRYSLVQLEDSRTGYVSNKNMAVAPPRSQRKPADSPGDEPATKPRRKTRVSPGARPSPSPASQVEKLDAIPSPAVAAPSPTPPPDLPATPKVVPSPTPTPTPRAPEEKPKFRL